MVQAPNLNRDFCSQICTIWEQEHQLNLKWNFFATSHGKGVVDGLGGSVKGSVWRHIRSGQAHIPTAEQYTSVAKECDPNVLIHFIPKSSIDNMNAFLDAR